MLDKLFGSTKSRRKSPASPSSTDSSSSQNKNNDATRIASELDRFDRIFRSSRGYGFMDWDMASNQIHWHGGFLSYLGYDEAEVDAITDAQKFLRFVHAKDRRLLREKVVTLLKTGASSDDMLVRALRPDGSVVWVELRLEAVRDASGWAHHLSGLVFDVSKLKAAEQALKTSEARHARIIDGSNDGIWEWSAESGGRRMGLTDDGRLDWTSQEGQFTFSARCWEMLGFDAEEDKDFIERGLSAWRERVHPDDERLYDRVVVEHFTQKRPFDIEYRSRAKDGSWRWLRSRARASFDKYGRPVAMSGTNMDITELKEAEERVLNAKEEAEQASQAKSQFLSSMSHELRTPLNAILGFTQLFELDSNLTREQRQNIKEIKSAGKHLLELVGDVLDLAKIEAGHVDIRLENVLPTRIISECAALLKTQFETRELDVSIELNGLEQQAISADAIRLKQVLLNLIGNAAKYNKVSGKILVSVSLHDDARMEISVQDTGPGIPASLQTQLFQPFNRLGAERSGIEGTGVGLVITKQLVEQMGGEIDFTSEENVGSRFWVVFPLAEVPTDEHIDFNGIEDAGMEDSEAVPELCVQGPKSILYVEDNPSNQRLMEQVLGRFPQLSLTVVGLAVQGLYAARSAPPDLIILDVNLPGVSGDEMVQILKQDPITQDIPVVALSANVLAYDIQKGKDAGFDFYLTKPLNLSQLISVMNQLLD